MTRSSPAFALALWLSLSSQADGQETTPQEHVERGLAAASAGDTAAALYELQEAVRIEPKSADAHYYIARLYVARASAVESDFGDRMAAERALEKALSADPANPLYLLELGKLKLKQHIRVDALRLLKRSVGEAKRRGDPAVLGEVHYQMGTIYEMWYEALAFKRMRPILRGPPAAEGWQFGEMRISEYVNNYLDDSPEVSESGWLERDIMMEHYRSALRYEPSHVRAATRLLGHLYDDDRFTEYLSIAEPLAQRAPVSAEAHLFLGLVYHALGREQDATAAFRRAFELLPEEDQRAMQSLTQVLRRQVAKEYEALEPERRREYESRFWAITDPLYLTEANELWLEHIARAAYADLRYSEPEHGLRGWETDRGIIYIRYGRPDRIGVFAPDPNSFGDPYRVGQRTIVWSYGRKGPTFVFQQRPGYRHTRFAGDYAHWAAEYRHRQPTVYRIPSIPLIFEIPVQVARFRGARPGETAVEVHAGIPVDSLRRGLDVKTQELETGLFLLDPTGSTVERRSGTIALPPGRQADVRGLRSWRLIVPTGAFFHLGVEARDPLSWRSATARDTFTAEPYERGRLQLSDILLADFLHPLAEEPVERDELELRPNPGLSYVVGVPVHLYYEIYDLRADSLGLAAYEVSLSVRVKKVTREGGFAQLLGSLADAWGFSIVGDDRVEVRFERELKLGERDRAIGWYTLDIQKAPPGEYEIRIQVTDRMSGDRAERTRSFAVVRPEESE